MVFCFHMLFTFVVYLVLFYSSNSFKSNLKVRVFRKSSVVMKFQASEAWMSSFVDYTGFGADYMKYRNSKSINDMGLSGTYGEILPESIRSQITSNLSYQFNKDDIMYDLGSGIGKVVTQFAYETECGVCIGIELGERRSFVSKQILEKLRISVKNEKYSKKIKFLSGDVLLVPWTDATVVFVNAICFSESLWKDIENLLLRSCDNLRLLFIVGPKMKGIGGQSSVVNKNGKKFCYHKIQCSASWEAETEMFCYQEEKVE